MYLYNYLNECCNHLRKLCFMCFFGCFLFNQPIYSKDKITVSEVLNYIGKYNGNTCTISDKIIIPDKANFDSKWLNYKYELKKEINTWIIFNSCEYEGEFPIVLLNTQFNQPIEFQNIYNFQIGFSNCNFYQFFSCSNNSVFKGLSFQNCVFEGQFYTRYCKFEGISFDDCRFEHLFTLWDSEIEAAITFTRCNFYYKSTKEILEVFFKNHIAIEPNAKKIGTVKFTNCNFQNNLSPSVVEFQGNFDKVEVRNCDFGNEIIDFYSSVIEKIFIIRKCKFLKQLGFENFSMPDNTDFSFAQINDYKIAIYPGNESLNCDYDKPMSARSDSIFNYKSASSYNELISIYGRLNNIYRNRGDKESENISYIEMKDIKANKAKIQYFDKPSLEKLIDWKLETFLKLFCDYGTNYTKSMIYSIYVIFSFAFLYFIFPSERDGLFVNEIIDNINLQTNSKLKVKTINHFIKKDYHTLNNIKHHKLSLNNYCLTNKHIINKVYLLFYNSLILLISLKILVVKYLSINFSQGIGISRISKLRFYINILLYNILYLFYGLFVRIFHAMMLSINAFVTLGYGEISARGIARYFCVIEGFIGWFLLSIFSVCLINQVL